MPDIPANTTTTATLEGLISTGSFSGQLETPADHDWIRMTLTAGVVYDFYLSFLITGSVAVGNSILALRDAAGTLLDSDDDSGVGSNSFLEFTAPSSGTYFLDIGQVNGTQAGEYSVARLVQGDATNAFLFISSDDYTGLANERIVGGAGGDHLEIGAGFDALGEQGNDIIIGSNVGTNRIFGGLGDDWVEAGSGGDIAFGDAGNDVVFGGGDGDTIFGGPGNDILDGDAGTDVLYGGLDKDYLTGGFDEDTFVLLRLADSPRGAGRDVIQDFLEGGTDVIDLQAIDAKKNVAGNQAFKFIGAQNFHHRTGELHYKINAAHNLTLVEGDVNGDGKADFQIQLSGQHGLHATDFEL